MSVAKAPGKVVLSGAYAVLEGAPAIVSAVDRYALADSARAGTFITPEVSAALGERQQAPWFDAEELRAEGRKLGLGSSAAILAASLAVLSLDRDPAITEEALQQAVFEPALRAHAKAQGGGSGIDVAASTYGGILIAQRRGGSLLVKRAVLPAALHLEVWACARPASTPELIGKVYALRNAEAILHARLLGAQAEASEAAALAVEQHDARALLAAWSAQFDALSKLGEAARAPIVTSDIEILAAQARQEGAIVIPSGAGGGDIALFAGLGPPSESLQQAADRCGITQLSLRLGARGVHRVPAE